MTKVVDLFDNPTETTTTEPGPRGYIFVFKNGDKVPAFGYPAFNGAIYATLDVADDARTINFICSAGDILYVAEDEEEA